MGVDGKVRVIPQTTLSFRTKILCSHSLTLRGHLIPLNLSVSFLKTRALWRVVRKNFCEALQNCKATLSFSSLQGSDSLTYLWWQDIRRKTNTKHWITSPAVSPQLCHCRPASWVEVLGLEGTLAYLMARLITPQHILSAAPSAACQHSLLH